MPYASLLLIVATNSTLQPLLHARFPFVCVFTLSTICAPSLTMLFPLVGFSIVHNYSMTELEKSCTLCVQLKFAFTHQQHTHKQLARRTKERNIVRSKVLSLASSSCADADATASFLHRPADFANLLCFVDSVFAAGATKTTSHTLASSLFPHQLSSYVFRAALALHLSAYLERKRLPFPVCVCVCVRDKRTQVEIYIRSFTVLRCRHACVIRQSFSCKQSGSRALRAHKIALALESHSSCCCWRAHKMIIKFLYQHQKM